MPFGINKNPWIGSRTSMSGSDIVVTFEDIRIGFLQGISISVSREKAPIYVLGSETPVSFSRGELLAT